MANKTLNAWGVSYLRGCLLYLLVTALVVPLGCACIGIPLYVVRNGNYDDATTLLILVVPMAGFFLLVVGGSLGFAAWMIRSRQRQLDEAFTPLGRAGSMHYLNGRQYHSYYCAASLSALSPRWRCYFSARGDETQMETRFLSCGETGFLYQTTCGSSGAISKCNSRCAARSAPSTCSGVSPRAKMKPR